MGSGWSNDNATLVDPPGTFAPLGSQWDYIREHTMYPWVHIVYPFTLFMYTRSWTIQIAIILLNEVVEAIIRGSISDPNSSVLKQLNEIPLDSLFGDVLNGILGGILAEAFLAASNWNFHFLPLDVIRAQISDFRLVLKYVFQLIVIGAPFHFVGTTFDYANYSLGYIIALGWYPIFLWIFYVWNQNDFLWKKFVSRMEENGSVTTRGQNIVRMQNRVYHQYAHRTNMDNDLSYTPKLKHLSIEWIRHDIQNQTPWIDMFYVYWTILYVVFSATFFYRYTYVYIMSVSHALLFIIILYAIAAIRRRNSIFYVTT